jgi:hypothetical protein
MPQKYLMMVVQVFAGIVDNLSELFSNTSRLDLPWIKSVRKHH